MITCWPTIYRVADGVRVSIRALRERVASPKAYGSKNDVPRFSTGLYEANYRDRPSFIAEEYIATDVGDYPGGATRDEIEEAFAGLRGFAYATWSSTIEEPRYRVVIELSRRSNADEHDRIWRAVADFEERAGLKPDHSSKGAPHPWALPARHGSDNYEHFDLNGRPLDVEAALEMFPKPEPMPPHEPRAVDDSYERRLDRAAKYLAAMPGAIQGSGGSTTTFRAALAMTRGFGLEPVDALRLLVEVHDPKCLPRWSIAELQHKVRQAVQRGRLPVGAITNRGRAA